MHTIGRFREVTYIADPKLDSEFCVSAIDETLAIEPRRSAAHRRTLRPLALFRVELGRHVFTELNISMGRIEIPPRSTAIARYRPYSPDPRRTLLAAFIGEEPSTGEDAAYLTGVCDWVYRRLASDSPEWMPSLDAQSLRVRAGRFAELHAHAHGWFHITEMHLLDLIARRSAQRAGCVIEIGTYQGRSTSVIAAALGDCGSDALVIGIDPNVLCDQQAEAARINVASVGQLRRFVQIQRTAAQAAQILAIGSARMAFIDGSHEYDDVVTDFTICDRLVAAGGFIVFHDIYPAAHLGYQPAVSGPTRALQEIVYPTNRYRPIAASHLTLALQKLSDET